MPRNSWTWALFLTMGLGFLPSQAAENEGALSDVYFEPNGYEVGGAVYAPRATVRLRNLRPVSELSPAAARSAWGRSLPYRHHIGVRVPPDSGGSGSTGPDAPLITVEDAAILATYVSQDTSSFMIMAGYRPPARESEERRPWMVYTEREAIPAQCDFVIQADGGADDTTLLEIVGVDAEAIYFAARSTDGEPRLVAASYSVAVEKGSATD